MDKGDQEGKRCEPGRDVYVVIGCGELDRRTMLVSHCIQLRQSLFREILGVSPVPAYIPDSFKNFVGSLSIRHTFLIPLELRRPDKTLQSSIEDAVGEWCQMQWKEGTDREIK
eukprot:2904530-Rhodomonas_salina.1